MPNSQPVIPATSRPRISMLLAQDLGSAGQQSDAGATRPAPKPRPRQNRFQRFLRSPKGTLTLVFLPLLYLAGLSTGWSRSRVCWSSASRAPQRAAGVRPYCAQSAAAVPAAWPPRPRPPAHRRSIGVRSVPQ